MTYRVDIPVDERIARRKAARHKWYEVNKTAILAHQSEYQRSLPVEKRRAIQQRWRDRNKASERLRARKKNWLKYGCTEALRPEPELCECCGKRGKRALSLDHCHKTGMFRGWLCDACNLGIGKLGDSVESVELALAYLRRAVQ